MPVTRAGLYRHKGDFWISTWDEKKLLLGSTTDTMIGDTIGELRAAMHNLYSLPAEYRGYEDLLLPLCKLFSHTIWTDGAKYSYQSTTDKSFREQFWAHIKYPYLIGADVAKLEEDSAELGRVLQMLNDCGPVMFRSTSDKIAKVREHFGDTAGLSVRRLDVDEDGVPHELETKADQCEYHRGSVVSKYCYVMSFSFAAQARSLAARKRAEARDDSPIAKKTPKSLIPTTPTINAYELRSFANSMRGECGPAARYIDYYCFSTTSCSVNALSNRIDVVEAIFGKYSYRRTKTYREFMRLALKAEIANLKFWMRTNQHVAFWLSRELKTPLVRLLRKGDETEIAKWVNDHPLEVDCTSQFKHTGGSSWQPPQLIAHEKREAKLKEREKKQRKRERDKLRRQMKRKGVIRVKSKISIQELGLAFEQGNVHDAGGEGAKREMQESIQAG